MKIAIIGSGISGNVAAYKLSRDHDVSVFEKRDRAGGHSATKDIDYTGNGDWMSVDTGFIVYNELNYPGLIALFDELGVDTEASDMSFAFSADRGRFEWSGQSLAAVFAQKRNFLNPVFWLMLRGIFKFNKCAARDHEAGNLGDESLGVWLKRSRMSKVFIQRYLLPMGAAIWSTPADEIMDFPARSFLQFFYNHRLINRDRPQWRTVSGGSREYVQTITQKFADKLHLNAEVSEVRRTQDGVILSVNGEAHRFDEVIFACHTDQALAILQDPTPQEASLLSRVRYLPNDVYLHRDERLMPKRKITWSAWNYLTQKDADSKVMTVSYWMNRLQNLDDRNPVFVTLNPLTPPAADKVFGHYRYDHPQFDADALQAQVDLPSVQGSHRAWFCGAWAGYGFHEDGLQSALRVVAALEAKKQAEDTSSEAAE
jgi:predicted NAD/FAD-binding protein